MESNDDRKNALRAQLNLVESTFSSEQRDASSRLGDDLRLRSEIAARLARETVWKQAYKRQILEIQQFSAEAICLNNHTLMAICLCPSECQNSSSELAEVIGYFPASRATLTNFEHQAYTWKEEYVFSNHPQQRKGRQV